MTTKTLQEKKVNPYALRLPEDTDKLCEYCRVRKAKYKLSFKVAASKYCCESYHGDCPSLKNKILDAEKRYGPDYYKHQEEKRRQWAIRNRR
jgi:hypothetical protein